MWIHTRGPQYLRDILPILRFRFTVCGSWHSQVSVGSVFPGAHFHREQVAKRPRGQVAHKHLHSLFNVRALCKHKEPRNFNK